MPNGHDFNPHWCQDRHDRLDHRQDRIEQRMSTIENRLWQIVLLGLGNAIGTIGILITVLVTII